MLLEHCAQSYHLYVCLSTKFELLHLKFVWVRNKLHKLHLMIIIYIYIYIYIYDQITSLKYESNEDQPVYHAPCIQYQLAHLLSRSVLR